MGETFNSCGKRVEKGIDGSKKVENDGQMDGS